MRGADPELFVFNGIDASTGGYVTAPRTAAELARAAQGQAIDPAERAEARRTHDAIAYAAREDIDPRVLAEAGWGVVFAHGADPQIREALAPLLAHRRDQAAAIDERRYREFVGPDAHRPGERKQAFLARHGAGRSGPVDPDRMPYYLLLVGDPERVPFEFQSQLDVQYAVGRLHFDALADYEHYARSVVRAETGAARRKPGLTLCATRHPGDVASQLAHDHLIGGLEISLQRSRKQFPTHKRSAEHADKAGLARLLGGPDTPALLFTAGHGMSFPADDPRQRDQQGALLAQDWPGPTWSRPIPPDFYFTADDIPADADLLGMIAFLFACHGGGTPHLDAFAPRGAPRELAPRSFIARLPMQLLAHPRGGALAVVAHVDRTWACSFHGGRTGPQIETYTSALKRLIDGHPVGSAMEYFGARQAELASDLALELEDAATGLARELELADLWTASADARNFLVLGDPAVRMTP